MRKLLILLLLLLQIPVWAQIHDPVKWEAVAKKTGANEYDLVFTAKLEKGWHLYSQKVKDETLIPPSFTFTPGKYKLVGEIKEVGKIVREIQKEDNIELLYYKEKASFIQHIKTTQSIKNIEALVYFSVCDDSKCLPPVELEFDIPLGSEEKAKNVLVETPETKEETKLFTESPNMQGNGAKAEMLNPVKWSFSVKPVDKENYELHFTADIEKGWHIYGTEKTRDDGPSPTEFAFDKNDNIELIGKTESNPPAKKVFDSVFGFEIYTIENKANFIQKIRVKNPVNKITGKLNFMTCDDMQCLPPTDVDFSFAMETPDIKPAEVSTSGLLLSVFGQGFAGGLLALLTPCVFPMIPLTVSFFTKKGSKKGTGSIGSALLFGLSIIGIYVSIGFLITLIFGFDALNGIASNLYLNFIFFALFFIFALSFLGAFDITLPSSWANKADEKSEKGGIIGIFFMAFTLAIVSFSCTGVIIGSLLVEATKGGYSGPITGMLGFSVALALPFTLFAVFPSWMQSLPKSGGWLNSVKVVLGFIELALAFKFLSTADLIGHWDFFKREYFLVVWIVIFALMGMYLLGKLKLSHDSDVPHVTVPRLLLAILSFSFAIYMVPGLWGAPVKLLSGLAPPLHYNEGFINGNSGLGESHDDATNDEDKPQKNIKLFHAPHGLTAFFDYDEALAVAKRQNKPIMLDFTGFACVNCRKMEDNVWIDPKVLNKIKKDYILVQLYVDDKTSLPENEVYTSKFSNKKIKTIGAKWSDFQASKFNTNSQPYYVLLDHNEKTLVTPRGYDPNIDSYAKFLQDGLAEFKNRK